MNRRRNWNYCLFVLFLFGFELGTANGQQNANSPKLLASKSWSISSKTLLASYWLGSAIDAGQTIRGLKFGATEMNPLLGKNPPKQKIYGIKLAVGLVSTILCRRASENERRVMLISMNLIQWTAVAWNGNQPQIGLRMEF